jgi:hypothetical protein
MSDVKRATADEVIETTWNDGVKRTTISHHGPCQTRIGTRYCGCDPIVVVDYITPERTESVATLRSPWRPREAP